MKCSWWRLLRVYLIWVAIIFILWLPIAVIVCGSFKSLIEFSDYPPHILPRRPTFQNYLALGGVAHLWDYLRNTIILMVGTTLGTLISSSLVAYPLARMNFRGRNLWFGTILATMMVPSCVTIIPQYILFSKLGWLNTFWPLIVPAWFAYPYNVFLFRQFYRTIPPALDEAARIDGASEWQIFAKIVVPLSRPVFITIGLLSSIFWWNEFFLPLVFIQSEELKPLSVGIYSFARTLFRMRWDLVMTIASLMLIPPLLIFALGRRYITEGIKTTGLK
ncbi:carbohydrate ABC transporter permease [candidate division WOR-3 bacterium]|nr:carbohydrate ABC transporter permease [candidate division WOR-3 bacterium]